MIVVQDEQQLWSAQGCSRENRMCKGALSNPAVGGTKKAAILESEVKGEQSDQAGEVLRSQIMGNYKSLVRPVILNDGIGHSCDSVLPPGLIQLSWRPACSLGKPKTQTHFGKHSAHPPTSTHQCQRESCDIS